MKVSELGFVLWFIEDLRRCLKMIISEPFTGELTVDNDWLMDGTCTVAIMCQKQRLLKRYRFKSYFFSEKWTKIQYQTLTGVFVKVTQETDLSPLP